ncbi:cation:proton antiporter [Aeromicrobium sp. NPDC092404]|uniref:cation:proton antiporter domain-containing protein n=1 Tax=Aeromicrobium sp. NPDC092404 TaxID=3154976 RepID=UPI003429BA0F
MTADLVYLLGGTALLIAVVLPYALRTAALSPPVVLLGLGALIGLLPGIDDATFSPIEQRVFVEHLAEFTVLVALMGVGLALDRPLSFRSFTTWRRWGATWRLLAIAMPLTIAGVALLGWWVMGLAPATALLLGAALAPTDPVLASDVQVEGPTTTEADEDEIDEDDEVRFALTSEAGLNDGLAFPFVYAAILLAGTGPVTEWGVHWFAWDLVGKVVVGAVLGTAVGWVLAKVAFRSNRPSLRAADSGEPLLALAAVLLAYGVTEVAHGYGFLAVFACAMTMRSAERGHDYHALMHDVVERLERLLTLIVLLLLGVALTNGLLAGLTWQAVVVAVLLLLVVRPVSGMIALFAGRRDLRVGGNTLGRRERAATAFFGVRGVGSIFYLAYAAGHADFDDLPLLWSTVGLAITLSVILHGVTATPAMRWLDAKRDDA